jgi:hypothetical protein
MTSNRAMRASDEDRERIATALGGHYAAGRLTLEEFQERLDRAYAAKTFGELADLMTDLPGTDLRQLRGQRGDSPPLPEPRAPGTIQARDASLIVFWRIWFAVAISVFVLWLASGAAAGPWLFLAAIGLVFVVLRRLSKRAERHIRDHHQTHQ